MDSNKGTLAIYGIPDIQNNSYPFYVHDHNMAYFESGEIQKFTQLERLTRRKYDHRLPEYIYTLLKEEDLLGDRNFDLVFVDNVIGRAFINKEGNIRFEAPLNKKMALSPEEGKAFWLDRHTKGYAVNHELAHVFSNLPFYGDFEDNSLHIHFDGGASKGNFSAWLYKDGQLQLLEYHWDLKFISSLFNSNALTFSIIGTKRENQNSMPGKFMGYAAYGEYDNKIEDWLRTNNYFENIWGNKNSFFKKLKNDWDKNLNHFDLYDPFIQNIAATIQQIFERELLKKLNQLQEKTGAKSLYYTGGSALNIKANSRIIEEKLFDKLYIPPPTNDSGLSIGAGAFVEWIKHGKIKKASPYLNNWGLKESKVAYSMNGLNKLVNLISENKVVGIWIGFGEAGPRALGNRSIIARPDSVKLAEYVSQDLKGREWYRPIAPVMLAKNLKYFTGFTQVPEISKYMLMDFHIIPAKKKELAGCVHVDGTSRIQIIQDRTENPFLYDLLVKLEEKTGIKALINTSFNRKGKPIVHFSEDARREAKEMNLDYLVLSGKLEKV